VNRKELIAQVENGACKIKSYKLTDFALALSTPTAAKITCRAEQDAVCNGKLLPRDLNVSATYLKYNGTSGNWRIVEHEETVSPAAAPDSDPR